MSNIASRVNLPPLTDGRAAGAAGDVRLRTAAVNASMWTIGGYAATRSIKLISSLILTRLLIPEAFGVMVIVNVFVMGLNMFSDIGIGPSIIQNKRGDDPRFLNTAWTIQVFRGMSLWLCSCLLAWPVAVFYGDKSGLLWLIPVAGLNALIAGFNSTSLFTLNRHLLLKQETVLDFSVRITSLIVTVTAALITRSVWALVIGGVVCTTVRMLISHTLLPGPRNRFCWDTDSRRALFHFGRWIFFSTILTFFALQTDRLMLGKMIPAAMLGVYSIAYMLYDVPRALVVSISQKVIFPTISKRTGLPRETLRALVLKNRRPILLAMAVGLAMIVSFGDLAVHLLYDARYAGAAWMLPILAAGLWFRVLDQTISPALMAIHKLQYNPIGSSLRLAFIVVGLPLAVAGFGLPGAVIVIALADIPNYLTYLVGLSRNKLSGLSQDLAHTAVFCGVVLFCLAVRSGIGIGTPVDNMFDDQTWMEDTAQVAAVGSSE